MAYQYKFKDDEESKRYYDGIRKMEENSAAWHETDDPEKKQMLHFDNQRISGELDLIDGGNRKYDEATGVWSTDFSNGNKQTQQPVYQSPLNNKIDQLYDEIVGGKSFSYNPDEDPSYKAYENMYRREGDRALKSTLAEVSDAQGGISSYAVSAAQQANNAYNQALTDKIPELEALAYQKFVDNRNDKYNQLSSLLARDDTLYNRAIYDDETRYNRAWNEKLFENEEYWKNKEFDWNEYWQNKNYNTENERYILERQDNRNDVDLGHSFNATQLALQMLADGITPPKGLLNLAYLTPENIGQAKYYDRYGYFPEYGGKSSKKKTTSKKEIDDEDDEPIDGDDEPEKTPLDKAVDNIVSLYDKGIITEKEAQRRIRANQNYYNK